MRYIDNSLWSAFGSTCASGMRSSRVKFSTIAYDLQTGGTSCPEGQRVHNIPQTLMPFGNTCARKRELGLQLAFVVKIGAINSAGLNRGLSRGRSGPYNIHIIF